MVEYRRLIGQLLVPLVVGAGWMATVWIGWDVPLWEAETWDLIARYIAVKHHVPDWLLGSAIAWLTAGVAAVLTLQILPMGGDYGQARWAKIRDLRKMDLRGSYGFVLGLLRWVVLRTANLSVVVLGPAGTGKTSCVIVPSILSLGKRMSAMVHDTKGELATMTAGARGQLGKVFVVNMAGGSENSACWNPIACSELPKDGAARGDLVDRYWGIILPAARVGQEDFFERVGRLLGAAATLYQIYDHESRKQDTSFGKVLKWLSSLRIEAEEDQEGEVDEVRAALEEAAFHAEDMRWPSRIADGLRQIAQFDYRTRSNILGTVFAYMSPWLNDNISECTARCDFHLADYHGVGPQRRPITTYWKAPPFDADLYGKIAGMHAEALVRYLTAREPDRKQLQVAMVLDEAKFLPRLRAIEDGPAIIRGFGVRMLVAFQDLAQARVVYGHDQVDAMWTNYGFRVVFAQNNLNTAKFISESIGQKTRIRLSWNRQVGLGRSGGSEGEAYEGVPLIRPQEIMSMPKGRVIVGAQYHQQTPIRAKAAHFSKLRLRRLVNMPLPPEIQRALNPVGKPAARVEPPAGLVAPASAPATKPVKPKPAAKPAKAKGGGKGKNDAPMSDADIASFLKEIS